jgi:DNA-binding response OmpR family regulator
METNRKHGRSEMQQPPRALALGNPLGDLAHRFWSARPLGQATIEAMRATALMPGGDFNPGSMLPLAPVRVRCGDLEVDRTQRRALLSGNILRLTRREYALLLCLIDNVNRVVSRSELLAKIWTLTDAHGSNVVDVYVRRLRRKLGAHADMIKTVRGFGYRLRPPLGI